MLTLRNTLRLHFGLRNPNLLIMTPQLLASVGLRTSRCTPPPVGLSATCRNAGCRTRPPGETRATGSWWTLNLCCYIYCICDQAVDSLADHQIISALSTLALCLDGSLVGLFPVLMSCGYVGSASRVVELGERNGRLSQLNESVSF